MDAKSFLGAVLPWTEGYTTIHWQKQGADGFPGRSCKTLDDVITALSEIQELQANTYFCLSRQRVGGGKRSRAGAAAILALWMDIDLGEEPGKYQTAAQAISAVLRFCLETGIPRPSLIVLSGGGVHVYWLSVVPLTVEEWQPYADGLKATAAAWGLKADLAVTGDAARVLRVPGTLNYKYDPPRPVVVFDKYSRGEKFDFAATFATLVDAAPAPRKPVASKLGAVPDAFKHLDPGNLGEGITDALPPMPFPAIKAKCAWLREAHDTGGAHHDQPQWHLAVLAATFMENGHALAHEFGNKHPDYKTHTTDAMWQRKLDDRAAKDLGWPRCRSIQDAGSTFCKACPHFLLDKSPLHLGLEAVKEEQKKEDAKDLGGVSPDDARLPDGFIFNEDGYLACIVPAKRTKNGVEAARLVTLLGTKIGSPSLQYQDGVFGIGFVASTDRGNTQEVFLSSANVYKPGLYTTLGKNAVFYTPETDAMKMLERFTSSWIQKLMREDRAVRDTGTMGWRHAESERVGFVYGSTMYREDGTESQLVIRTDDEFRKWYLPIGKPSVWFKAAKLLTDRKRPELDIIIAIGFAAPLMIFTGATYGVMLSIWGDPGTSKSTAQQVAAAIYGHPKQTRESLTSTPKSVQRRLGLTKNLAAYWDDVQDERHQENLFQTMFVAAEGTEGGRLNTDATMKARLDWQTLLVACSNASFVEFLSNKQKSTTAGMRRVFEFEYNRNDDEPGMIDAVDASQVFAELEHNYGYVGAAYAKMLATKHNNIAALTIKITKAFKDKVKGTGDESYWWNACGAILTGAVLANKLGAQLDIAAMDLFLQEAYEKNRRARGDSDNEGGSKANTEQGLVSFLNTFTNSGNTLFVDRMFKHKHIQVNILRNPEPRCPVFIQVSRDERKITFSRKAMRDYLQKQDIRSRQIFDGLAKYYGASQTKITLGAGTLYSQTQEYCLEIVVPKNPEHALYEIVTACGTPVGNGPRNVTEG